MTGRKIDLLNVAGKGPYNAGVFVDCGVKLPDGRCLILSCLDLIETLKPEGVDNATEAEKYTTAYWLGQIQLVHPGYAERFNALRTGGLAAAKET